VLGAVKTKAPSGWPQSRPALNRPCARRLSDEVGRDEETGASQAEQRNSEEGRNESGPCPKSRSWLVVPHIRTKPSRARKCASLTDPARAGNWQGGPGRRNGLLKPNKETV